MAETIPDDWVRSGALAGIAGRLAAIDPRDPALIRQAIAVAETIPRDGDRSRAVAAIAECLAAVNPGDPALIDQAIAVAETIPASWERSEALAGIAERLAVIDPARTATLIRQARQWLKPFTATGSAVRRWARSPSAWPPSSPRDPALIDQAIAVAETIPGDWVHGRALAGIAERLAVIDPARTATLIRQARTIAETSPNDSYVLSTIVERLAAADPPNPVLIDQAIAVARAIPRYRDRGEALAAYRRAAGRHRPGLDRRADRPGHRRGRNHPRQLGAQRGTGRYRRAAGRRRSPEPGADQPSPHLGRNHPRPHTAR